MENQRVPVPEYQKSFHALRLQDLILQCHLGCGPDERSVRQEVRLSIEFQFQEAPVAEKTDELADTICYADVALALKKKIESQEYKLLEKLAADAYSVAKEMAGRSVGVGLSVQKVRPPVEGLVGGSWYRCGDFAL